MIFSSLTFLFCFFPIVFFSHFLVPKNYRNIHLLLASLFFYSWGETFYVLLMLLVIGINFALGLTLPRLSKKKRIALLATGLFADLSPLLYFKYSGFIVTSLFQFSLLPRVPETFQDIHLPLGISFFTFQAISYLVDIYRQESEPQKSLVNLGLYIALFPQLIAGPIVRYHDIASQISHRTVTWTAFTEGIERFILGLAKKVLIANTLGQMADLIFSIHPSDLSTSSAWLGAVSYTLQIYFDFSAYSDMAIGLGLMFGFRFLENFNYPYISKSIQEFWRRWHISLSNWFRDYLYIPLGGNRNGKWQTTRNLFFVFFLCGLWHGASWNFIVWGLFHGAFLSLERTSFKKILDRTPTSVRHIYVLLIVISGWVIFRADDMAHAGSYLATMFMGSTASELPFRIMLRMDTLFWLTLICGIVFSYPVLPALREQVLTYALRHPNVPTIWEPVNFCALLLLFVLTASSLATGTYNPFIYFRF